MSSNSPGDFMKSQASGDAGQTESQWLARYEQDGWAAQEKSPELSYQLFTQGRDEARRLNEPWWVLHYEYCRLNSLTSFLMDFTRAAPLATELMARFSTPQGLTHGDRLHVLHNVLYTYVNTDPLGFREDLEKGFAYLDREIAPGPVPERAVLYHRWQAYLIAIEDWEAVYEMALRSLALLTRLYSVHSRNWYTAWTLDQHCQICYALGKRDELAGHADHLVEVSQKRGNLLRTEATGLIWQAFCRRAKGDEKAASKSFHRGMALLEDLERRDSICADAIAAYYEAGGDLKAAIAVRDREFAEVSRKGMLHRSCQIQIEQCRLLDRARELTPADLEAVRRSATRLRLPKWYLDKLRRCEAPGHTDAETP
jgi:hypothetical protein